MPTSAARAGWIDEELRRGVPRAPRARVGAQRRGLDRRGRAGRRGVRRGDRRAVRGGVDVPPADRRREGGAGGAGRAAARAAARSCSTCSGPRRTSRRWARSRCRGRGTSSCWPRPSPWRGRSGEPADAGSSSGTSTRSGARLGRVRGDARRRRVLPHRPVRRHATRPRTRTSRSSPQLMPTLPGYEMRVDRVTTPPTAGRYGRAERDGRGGRQRRSCTPEALVFDLDPDGRIRRIQVFIQTLPRDCAADQVDFDRDGVTDECSCTTTPRAASPGVRSRSWARGVDTDVVEYLKAPPDRADAGAHRRRHPRPARGARAQGQEFEELGLDAADYTDREAVIELCCWSTPSSCSAP